MPAVKTLLVGFLAALVAGLWNQLLLGRRVRDVPAALGPFVEEALKTGLALITGTSLPGVHITFGLVEGLWELGRRPMAAGPERSNLTRWGPALAALGGHTFFGWLAFQAYNRTGQPGLAWAVGFLAHLAWNRGVISLHCRAWHRYKT
ncbi:hypothetical protein SDD30_06375 [Moorella naiadis]|uniref:hypothetical protein n=1 Tax=Moorella naiadis (nom. illeg.) TaxID=3093670 RepID=UPI003D9C93BE